MGLLDIFNAVTPIVQKALDYIPDPVQKAQAQAQLVQEQMAFAQAQFQGQLDVDKAEAANGSTFVAGWRPFIGWICGLSFGYQYLVQPMFSFGLAAFGHTVTMPSLPSGDMMTVLLGMLGLGGMRTVEKIQGVAPAGAK